MQNPKVRGLQYMARPKEDEWRARSQSSARQHLASETLTVGIPRVSSSTIVVVIVAKSHRMGKDVISHGLA